MGRAQNATATRRFDVVMGKRRGLLDPALHRDDSHAKLAIKEALRALAKGDTAPAIDLLSGLQKEQPITPAGEKLILALARHYVEEVALGSTDPEDNELMLAQESFRALLGEKADEEPLLDTISAIDAVAEHLAAALVERSGLMSIAKKTHIKGWYEDALAGAISANIQERGIKALREILRPDNHEWRQAIIRVGAHAMTSAEIDRKRLETVPWAVGRVLQVAKIMTQLIPAPRLFSSIEGRKYLRSVFVNAGRAEITGAPYRPPSTSSLLSEDEEKSMAKILNNLNSLLLVRDPRPQPKS